MISLMKTIKPRAVSTLSVRLETTDYRKLKRAAAKAGISVSEAIRQFINSLNKED